MAFAARIGARLRQTVEATVSVASSETGTALVPLLANRDAATERAAQAVFPELDTFAPAATDGEGWHAGTLFGDIADIGIEVAEAA